MKPFYAGLRFSSEGGDVISCPTEDDIRRVFLSGMHGQKWLGEVDINVYQVKDGEPVPFTGFSLSFYFGEIDRAVVSAGIDQFAVGENWKNDLILLPGPYEFWEVESKFFIPIDSAIRIGVEVIATGHIPSFIRWEDPHLIDHDVTRRITGLEKQA